MVVTIVVIVGIIGIGVGILAYRNRTEKGIESGITSFRRELHALAPRPLLPALPAQEALAQLALLSRSRSDRVQPLAAGQPPTVRVHDHPACTPPFAFAKKNIIVIHVTVVFVSDIFILTITVIILALSSCAPSPPA